MSETVELLVEESALRQRVMELAKDIDAMYPKSRLGCANADSLVMICVLKGAFMFFSDLVRHVTCHPVLDFIGMSSYGSKMSPDGRIDVTKDVTMDLAGRDVLIVEDIVDTGHSMNFLLERLQSYGPRSLRLATLIDKRERREVPVPVDFSGFCLEGFLVGYGLDYAERYRELPALYIMHLDA